MVPRGSEVAAAARKRWLRVEEFPYRGEADVAAATRILWRFSRRDVEIVHLHSRRGADTLGGLAGTLVRAPVVLTRRVDNREIDWIVGAKYGLYRRIVAISGCRARRPRGPGGPQGEDLAWSTRPWMRPYGRAPRAQRRATGSSILREGSPPGAMVAQFVPRKGHWVLMHALAILKRHGHSPNIVLFGRGPMRDKVAALAETAGGPWPDPLRPAFGTTFTVGLAPSTSVCIRRSGKDLGWAALQAGAAGLPVIGGRAGGIPEGGGGRQDRTAVSAGGRERPGRSDQAAPGGSAGGPRPGGERQRPDASRASRSTQWSRATSRSIAKWSAARTGRG